MSTRKITVTLAEDRLQQIRALVTAGRAANVSAFLRHAVAVALSDAAEWNEMLKKALQQTGGPLTPEERAWADSLLSGSEGKSAQVPSMPAPRSR